MFGFFFATAAYAAWCHWREDGGLERIGIDHMLLRKRTHKLVHGSARTGVESKDRQILGAQLVRDLLVHRFRQDVLADKVFQLEDVPDTSPFRWNATRSTGNVAAFQCV